MTEQLGGVRAFRRIDAQAPIDQVDELRRQLVAFPDFRLSVLSD